MVNLARWVRHVFTQCPILPWLTGWHSASTSLWSIWALALNQLTMTVMPAASSATLFPCVTQYPQWPSSHSRVRSQELCKSFSPPCLVPRGLLLADSWACLLHLVCVWADLCKPWFWSGLSVCFLRTGDLEVSMLPSVLGMPSHFPLFCSSFPTWISLPPDSSALAILEEG